MSFNEVVSFFELFIKFQRQRGYDSIQIGDSVDKSALVEFANDRYFSKKIDQLTLFQISCLYWIYNAVGSIWNKSLMLQLEN